MGFHQWSHNSLSLHMNRLWVVFDSEAESPRFCVKVSIKEDAYIQVLKAETDF